MSSEIETIGIGHLSNDDLEEIASKVEEKILQYLKKHRNWKLLTDFNIIIKLSQDINNLLTSILDFEIIGELTSEQSEKLHEELLFVGRESLREELLCRKNS
jgi:hypothetical protein